MFVSIQCLHAALVPEVPHSQSLVVTGRYKELPTRVEYDATDPVVVPG